MIAGHAPLAFALVASVAVALGATPRRALLLGVVAGAFAVVPDVDMSYALVGVLTTDATGVWGTVGAFWTHSSIVHRAVTHSIVLGVPAAAAFALAPTGGIRRRLAIVILVGLVAVGLASGGPLAAAMIGLYAAAGTAVAAGAALVGIDTRSTFLAALAALVSHPFGDLFTGTPPQLFYPVDVGVALERVVLHPDPTLNLLAVFGLELASLWLAVVVAARLAGWPIRGHLDRRVAAGSAYGLVAFVMPAPTLDVSYHFVFSVLALGSIGVGPLVRRIDARRLAIGAVRGLGAVTIGVATYAVVYAAV